MLFLTNGQQHTSRYMSQHEQAVYVQHTLAK